MCSLVSLAKRERTNAVLAAAPDAPAKFEMYWLVECPDYVVRSAAGQDTRQGLLLAIPHSDKIKVPV